MRRASGKKTGVLSGLPLVETHLHLEGSFPARILQMLSRARGKPLPARAGGPGRPLQRRRGFGPFLEAYLLSAALVRDREDLLRAASALFTDLAREGIRYAEITFSPQVLQRRGLAFSSVMKSLTEARSAARREHGITVSFIADGGRLFGPALFEEMVRQASEYRRDGIVAVGLGGDERAAPARSFRPGFALARRAGLGAVVHAGEGSDPRPLREALEVLQVTRIGHGIAAAGDRRLMERLARDRVLLEVCPTSNLMTGAVPSLRRHPLRRLLDAGVTVAIGSDDRAVFGTTLRRELEVAVRKLGVAGEEIPGLIENGVRGSFASSAERRRLLRSIRKWEAGTRR